MSVITVYMLLIFNWLLYYDHITFSSSCWIRERGDDRYPS